METYLDSLTSICAPLLVIQGVGEQWRPKEICVRERTVRQGQSGGEIDVSSFGVQLDIHRELDDVNHEVVQELVAQLEVVNTRGRKWWPQMPKNDQQQSVWFNVMYSDNHYDLAVNGSQSMLSPYRKNGRYFNTMVPLEWMSKYYDKIPIGFISIYELGEDDEYDDILVNEILRMKQQIDGTLTKYYCLIYTNGPIGEERSSKIRMKTEMVETNSLFFVTNVQTDSTINDRSIFISKLLLILKRHSNDFFNNQIKKLKVREAKNASYPEQLFTTRFLIKFSIFELIKGVSEYSTNLIIRSQSKLMKLLIDIKDDVETRRQIRTWLDVFTIHLIRSLIIMGSFNKAYQKLKMYINQINKTCGFDLNWVSIQFTWFAQLLECMGGDLVPLDFALLPNDPTTTATAGASPATLTTTSKTPHVGFIYLEALRYREMALSRSSNPSGDNRILLLNGALDMFTLSKNAKFNRIESMIYIKMGDIYFNELNFSMAINNFKAGLSNYENWSVIQANVVIKLLLCFKKMENWNECWKCLCQLICLDESIIKQMYVNNAMNKWQMKMLELKDGLQPVDIVNVENNLFNIECIIKKDSLEVGEDMEIQLKVQKLDSPLVEELKLNELVLEVNEDDPVLFKTNGSQSESNFHKFSCSNLGDGKCFTLPMDLTNGKELIIQYSQKVLEIGEYPITDLKIEGEVNGIKFKTTVKVSYPEYGFWIPSSKGEIEYPLVKTARKGPVIKVTPREPRITCLLKYNEVGYNGQTFPISLKFVNEDDLSDVKVHISGAGEILSDSDGKDLNVVFPSEGGEYQKEFRSGVLKRGDNVDVQCLVHLPQIFGLPYDKRDTNCKIKLKIKYLDGGSITESEREINLTVIELFKVKSTIRPVVGELNSSKKWKFKVNVTNLSFNDLTIKGFKINIKSLPEVDVNYTIGDVEDIVLGYKAAEDLSLQIDIESHEQIRSVPIEITGEVKYSSGQQPEEGFIIGVFNGRLPHDEARILVDFHPPGEVEYILENPTAERVQYQTNFSNENGGVRLLQEYPKAMNVVLEAHSKRSVKFQYEIKADGILLPEFTLFDRGNQKFKKVLSVSEDLAWESNQLLYSKR